MPITFRNGTYTEQAPAEELSREQVVKLAAQKARKAKRMREQANDLKDSADALESDAAALQVELDKEP